MKKDEKVFESELRKRIEDDPDIYRRVIAKVLAETEIEAREIIIGYAEAVGFRLYEQEISHIASFDNKRSRNIVALKEWKRNGKRAYSINDIPGWVFESNGTIRGKIELLARQIIKKRTEESGNFAITKDGVFFNDDGYMKIVMTASGSKWLYQDEIEKWQKETGLFDELLAVKNRILGEEDLFGKYRGGDMP